MVIEVKYEFLRIACMYQLYKLITFLRLIFFVYNRYICIIYRIQEN